MSICPGVGYFANVPDLIRIGSFERNELQGKRKQVALFKYRGDTVCVFPTLNHLAHGNQTGSFGLNKGFLQRSPCCFSTFLLKN